jgi:YVTN family beta-propeller protein
MGDKAKLRGRGPRRWWLAVVLAASLVGAAPAQAQPFVYVANRFASTVSQFDAKGGGLSALSPPTVASGGAPAQIAVRPDGKSVYVTNADDGTVSQYDVRADGTLTAKTPATVAAPGGPAGIAVSPDGKSVYVTDNAGVFAGTVSQYDVGSGGALTLKSPATVAAGGAPIGIAVTPDGKSVYVTNSSASFGGDTVSQYDVGAGGALTPKDPATVATGGPPIGVAVSPDNKSTYVTATVISPQGPAGVVEAYDVAAGGLLFLKNHGVVGTGGDLPFAVAVNPDGKSVYVVNDASANLALYEVAADGTLTPNGGIGAGSGPAGIAVNPDGKSVYVTNSIADTVSQYDVSANGVLRFKSPGFVPVGTHPEGIAVTPLPRVPTSKDQCKNGGWRNFPQFHNQGQCVAFIERGSKS